MAFTFVKSITDCNLFVIIWQVPRQGVCTQMLSEGQSDEIEAGLRNRPAPVENPNPRRWILYASLEHLLRLLRPRLKAEIFPGL